MEKKKITSSQRVYGVIERSLKKLVDEGKIAKIGAGKKTSYVDVKRLDS